MTTELLPFRSSYPAGDAVEVEVRAAPAGRTLRVLHLGAVVRDLPVTGDRVVDLGPLPPGGYGVDLLDPAGDRLARTAVEVADATRTLRYGFVADYRPGRDPAAVAENVRRLHLTDVQFYDWAYRHADLNDGETYDDALGQPIDLATVRALIDALHRAGARALGYAAVYGVGNAEWPRWADAALLTPSGPPYALGDFLRLVDPAEPRWLAHFVADLRSAVDRVGFDGFHLDQYGYPKLAVRPDGVVVSVQESFAALIEAARAALPSARLVFNNVNDFPTWRTGGTPQDAVYVEVWPPHVTLGHLAAVVTRARVAGGGKPVVVAAYQSVYDSVPATEADRATAFTMATLFSHGASQLLAGEADRLLVDPYYVRNHTVAGSTAALLRRWYDFDVEHGELLRSPDAQDVTGALGGDYNDDCDVRYGDGDGVRVTETATAGAVWRRIVAVGPCLVVHLINLVQQDDTEWDAPRKLVAPVPGGILRLRRVGALRPRVRVADPDGTPALVDLPVTLDGDHASVALPPLHVWQLVLVDPAPAPEESV